MLKQTNVKSFGKIKLEMKMSPLIREIYEKLLLTPSFLSVNNNILYMPPPRYPLWIK